MSEKIHNQRDMVMGQGEIWPTLLSFSFPAIVGMLVNALYSVVDRIFVGQGVGENAMAATMVAFPIMTIMMAVSLFVGIGSATLIAISLGQKNILKAEMVLQNAVIMAISAGILSAIFGSIFLDPLLVLFGATPEIMGYAREYTSIIIAFSMFNYLSLGLNHNMRASGAPKIAMMSMIIGAVINTILNYLFVMVLKWGIKGSAIATVIGQIVSSVWIISYFLIGNTPIRLRVKELYFKWSIVANIAKLGTAQACLQFVQTIGMWLLNKSIVDYAGGNYLASASIFNSLTMFIFMPMLGINQGVQPLMGYNFGAKRFDRVKSFYIAGVIAATALVTIGFILIQVITGALVAMFLSADTATHEVIQTAKTWVRLGTLMLPFVGFQVISTAYFQAIGDYKRAIVLSLLRQILFYIPALVLMPIKWGFMGIMLAQPVADALAVVTTGILIAIGMKKLNKRIADNNI